MIKPDLSMLSKRERHIYEARRLTTPPVTLAELARQQGCSRQRVSRIEHRAIAKLQRPTPEEIYDGLTKAEQRVITEAAAALRDDRPLLWERWVLVGEALMIIRSNTPAHSRLFTDCLHQSDLNIEPAVMARLFTVMRNRSSIEEWRASLYPTERVKINHPQFVLRAWKKWLAARSEEPRQ
jgi:transcriptional regulator with XRE-family HTH domain